MAGEIQIGGTTFATESAGTVTVSNVDSATNRTNLGLGSMATQNSSNVTITGGNITGGNITPWGDEIYLIDANEYNNTSRNFVIGEDGEFSFDCSCINPSNTGEALRMSGNFTVSSSTISNLEYSSGSANLSASSSGATLTLQSTATTREITAVIIYKEV